MKVRIFMRVGVNGRKVKVDASTKPNYASLYSSNLKNVALPTVALGLDLEIPDSEFDAPRFMLELKASDTQPAVSLRQVK